MVISGSTKAAMDYNGTPLSKNGGITITPQTPPSFIANYTQAINLDGIIDNNFGNTGIVTTDIGGVDIARACALQPDGKIIAVGYSRNGANHDFALVRYNANGTLDTTFGVDGKVTTAIGVGDDIARACALQPDGKIIAVGYSINDFVLVRYINPFNLVSFTASYGNVGLI